MRRPRRPHLVQALRRGCHLWVDSSLRSYEFWAPELQRIRKTYPRYRIAIIHVLASWERVEAREAKRGRQTGRSIPPELLRAVFEQVPRSVAMLSHLVDECITVDNNSPRPKLVSAEDARSLDRLCESLGGSQELLESAFGKRVRMQLLSASEGDMPLPQKEKPPFRARL